MAVISITESFLEGSNEATWTLQDSKLQHNYTRTLIAVTDDKMTLSHQILNATGVAGGGTWPHFTQIPSLGTVYFDGVSGEQDTFAICSSIAVSRIGQSLAWKVVMSYETWNPAFNNVDPTANQPRVSWSYARYEKIADQDIYGNAIVNTAFDPFDPPVVKDANRPVLKVTRTEANFDHQWAGDLESALNTDTFAGYPAGMVKVSNISATDRWDPLQGQLWDVEYEFEFDVDGWNKNVLSSGYRQLVSGNSVNILDHNGSPITTPALLDASGAQIPPGSSAPADALALEFVVHEGVSYGTVFNFGTVNFGTSGTLPSLPIAFPTVPSNPSPSGPVDPETPFSPSNPEA